ncbi:hypothetical protein L1887_01679 [Cichorium endivia]|nr:hypothetical protein L1887_01679 [Cichorium endivia]
MTVPKKRPNDENSYERESQSMDSDGGRRALYTGGKGRSKKEETQSARGESRETEERGGAAVQRSSYDLAKKQKVFSIR